MTVARLAIVGAVAVALTARGFAQLPMSKVLTVEVAEIIATEVLAKCRAEGLRASVVVVDSLNSPKIMLRDDGATPSTSYVAPMKATFTMLYDRPSGPPTGTPNPPAVIPGTVNARGGVPIKVGDVTIGAVGVSGTPGPSGDKDAVCAAAGIAKAADKLK
jgi:uncharacterized protein GlcG (DUF336 family)